MDFQNSYLPAGMIPTGTVPGGIAAIGLMDERIHNENAYENSHLTEAEKEELIFKYKDAETEAERADYGFRSAGRGYQQSLWRSKHRIGSE